jgi:hypothetical protein
MRKKKEKEKAKEETKRTNDLRSSDNFRKFSSISFSSFSFWGVAVAFCRAEKKGSTKQKNNKSANIKRTRGARHFEKN